MPDNPSGAGFVLAFDFGLNHIGTAVGQTITGTANPLENLRATQGQVRREAVDVLIKEWRPIQLVVGLPLNMDDSESEMSERARNFAAWLERTYLLPVALVDERLTTRDASQQVKGDRDAAHGVAAVLIAESYLSDAR